LLLRSTKDERFALTSVTQATERMTSFVSAIGGPNLVEALKRRRENRRLREGR
jgi:hypothetical protein